MQDRLKTILETVTQIVEESKEGQGKKKKKGFPENFKKKKKDGEHKNADKKPGEKKENPFAKKKENPFDKFKKKKKD
jgi:hypothetical protein